MAPTKKDKERHQISQESSAAGLLALAIEAREMRVEDDKDARKIEVVLDSVGLSTEDIVALTGKKPDAVRKTIQRGRARS
jgi:hypothetical protein